MASRRKKAAPRRKARARAKAKAATRRKSRPAAARKKAARPAAKKKRIPTSASIAGSFEMLLAPHARAVRDLATRLRALIRDSLPDAEEDVRGSARTGMALYSIGGSNRVVCGIQPSPEGCLLSVHYVDADDSSGLALRDEGLHTVHIKFRSINRDEEAALSALVRLARERLLA
jgi:hypothetical protein